MTIIRNQWIDTLLRGTRKLTGENLKVILVEFSTLSWTVFQILVIECNRRAHAHLELKTRRPRFPVSLSLSMIGIEMFILIT